MSQIYVLKLEHGNYYVGRSIDPIKRYQEHLNGTGSSWTRLHEPISFLETRPEHSILDEDKLTKEYMLKYGIDHVRGGSYVTIELSSAQQTAIQTELRSAKGQCTRCGQLGHFIKDCRLPIASRGGGGGYSARVKESSEEESSEEESSEEESSEEEDGCFRCGRTSHFARNCYASTDKYGNKI
jgi:cellular nucleic acid-binding protein